VLVDRAGATAGTCVEGAVTGGTIAGVGGGEVLPALIAAGALSGCSINVGVKRVGEISELGGGIADLLDSLVDLYNLLSKGGGRTF
jgi:hypothetical protein